MKKLTAVEDARAVMKEGMEWGVWKWLIEKKRVRGIADKARAALDEQEMQVKQNWPEEYKLAYNELVAGNSGSKRPRKAAKGGKTATAVKADAKIVTALKVVADADDEAYNAHEDAEEVFAEAERKMSTAGAREGAKMALVAYDRHEAAIKKAEAIAKGK
jgi:predicted  nucleic acid-binding Zn-ribbon protein